MAGLRGLVLGLATHRGVWRIAGIVFRGRELPGIRVAIGTATLYLYDDGMTWNTRKVCGGISTRDE